MCVIGRRKGYIIRKYPPESWRVYDLGIYRAGGAFVACAANLAQAVWIIDRLCEATEGAISLYVNDLVEASR